MKKAWLVFWVLLVASPAWAGPVEDSIEKGNQLVRKKDYTKATKEYENAAKADPKSSKANLLLSLAYANTNDMEKAIRYAKTAAELDPGYPSFYNLGLMHAKRKDYENAIPNYQKALEANPGAYRAWYQLGAVYAEKGDFQNAAVAYEKSIELNPQFPDAYLGLGAVDYWTGNKTKALGEVERLKKANLAQAATQLEEWIRATDGKKQAAAPSS